MSNPEDKVAEIVGDILNTFTYKPGWDFNLEKHWNEATRINEWSVVITGMCVDGQKLGHEVYSALRWNIPRCQFVRDHLEKLLRHWVFKLELRMAGHCMLFDGVRKFDPDL